MGFLNASSSFTRFSIVDPVPEQLWADIPDLLKKGALLDIDELPEMEAKGYRYVDTGKVDSDLDQDVAPEARADLGIQISYIVSTSYYTAYYPSYPWWLDYPGYWYPGYWGGWGSWYYSFPVTYGYSTHSLLTEMVDLTGETGDDKPLPVIWNSYIDGSIGGSRADAARFSRAVSQSFAQSEYLGK